MGKLTRVYLLNLHWFFFLNYCYYFSNVCLHYLKMYVVVKSWVWLYVWVSSLMHNFKVAIVCATSAGFSSHSHTRNSYPHMFLFVPLFTPMFHVYFLFFSCENKFPHILNKLNVFDSDYIAVCTPCCMRTDPFFHQHNNACNVPTILITTYPVQGWR